MGAATVNTQDTITGTISRQQRPRLWTEHLGVHFADRSALDSVSLEFHSGDTTAVVGPNGAGKSTLLRCLGGMLAPTHGKVFLDGQTVHRPSQRVAYVPQRSEIDWQFPISVLDVTVMGVALRGGRLLPVSAATRQAALVSLEAVGMQRFATVQIGALSGGQQQRVFIARALLQAADVLLLDEPFTGVDLPTQALVTRIFRDLRTSGKTIVFATHDLAMAEQSADTAVLLNRRVIATGPPSRVLTVPNLRAAFGGGAVLPDTFEPRQ